MNTSDPVDPTLLAVMLEMINAGMADSDYPGPVVDPVVNPTPERQRSGHPTARRTTMTKLNSDEQAVLAAFKKECEADPGGAFGPAYSAIGDALGASANSDTGPFLVFGICKNLKVRGLLDGTTGRGRAAMTSTYWITDKGLAALAASEAS
jgi:hypothetical protein